MKCTNCNKETKNPKYCSRSCSASVNNKKQKRRKLIKRYCKNCGIFIDRKTWKDRRKVCEKCKAIPSSDTLKKMTLRSMQERESTKGKHKSWINSNVRNLNRSWNKDLLELPCANCGYDKHVELCHIKAIKDFSLDNLLGEINAKNNIIQLCPNCHWEFDSGLLNLF